MNTLQISRSQFQKHKILDNIKKMFGIKKEFELIGHGETGQEIKKIFWPKPVIIE